MGNRSSKILFSNPFQKKRWSDESQKSGFRFNPKYPPRVWIVWIHDQFLDFAKKTQNTFLDSRIRFRIFPQNPPLVYHLPTSVTPRGVVFYKRFEMIVVVSDYSPKKWNIQQIPSIYEPDGTSTQGSRNWGKVPWTRSVQWKKCHLKFSRLIQASIATIVN